MLIFEEGRKPKDPEKNPCGKQLNSHEVPKPRIEPTTHWTTAVRGECITATPPKCVYIRIQIFSVHACIFVYLVHTWFKMTDPSLPGYTFLTLWVFGAVYCGLIFGQQIRDRL
jgi:hypothetical protein